MTRPLKAAGRPPPRPDGDFDTWQANFVSYASANAAALGLDPLVDIPPLTAAQSTWTTDHAANTTAQVAAQAARQAKEAARGALYYRTRASRSTRPLAVGGGSMPNAALSVTAKSRISTRSS